MLVGTLSPCSGERQKTDFLRWVALNRDGPWAESEGKELKDLGCCERRWQEGGGGHFLHDLTRRG